MRTIPGLAVSAALLFAGVANAQAQTPTRSGDTWGWHHHPPTEAQVNQEENAAGVASTRSRPSSDAKVIDQIFQQLMRSERPAG